jgi:hypothetical protein
MKSSQARRRIRRSGSSHERQEQRAQQFFGSEPTTPFFRPAASLQRAADDKKEPDAVQRAEDDKKKDEAVQRAPEDEKKIERAADDEHKEEGGSVQRKELTGGRSPSLTHHYIQHLSDRGQPLSTGEQAFFGGRMGRDFSGVRVHTSSDAAESARDVNAKAYTYGRHVVFSQGRYDATSPEGKALLAHELAHVVQQGNAPVLRVRNKPGRRGA